MPERQPPGQPDPPGSGQQPRRSLSPQGEGAGDGVNDLFSSLFKTPAAKSSTPVAPKPPAKPKSATSQSPRPPAVRTPLPASTAVGVSRPPAPRTLDEAGLSLMQICDLVLKTVYLQANQLGYEIARQLRLPFGLVEEALRFLKDEKCIEVSSGEVVGTSSYRFVLTDLGRKRAQEAFDHCRYVGPAPVPLEAYEARCRMQTVNEIPCTPQTLAASFSELIIRPFLLEELGPAVCSGKSIFLYGPPGNGKSQIAKGLGKFLNSYGGEIDIPYAVHTEGNIITMFDPTLHQTTDDGEWTTQGIEQENAYDTRWRRIRRPVIMTGGELTLEMLDLRYNRSSNFYTAPLHIKANGGVFLIDDFGRQIVSPKDLLNRWILPLEEKVDYLTLATGKKFSVPFEQLIIFSTNLEPRDLVDEAFLRRIRHKIKIGSPSRDLFTDIFQLCCEQRKIVYQEGAVNFLYSNFYDQGKVPRSSDPRDLLEIAKSICRFRDQDVQLTPELMAEATERFFCQL